MSNSAQNTVFKGYICYKVFAALGELGDIVPIYNNKRAVRLPILGESNRQCSHP